MGVNYGMELNLDEIISTLNLPDKHPQRMLRTDVLSEY